MTTPTLYNINGCLEVSVWMKPPPLTVAFCPLFPSFNVISLLLNFFFFTFYFNGFHMSCKQVGEEWCTLEKP